MSFLSCIYILLCTSTVECACHCVSAGIGKPRQMNNNNFWNNQVLMANFPQHTNVSLQLGITVLMILESLFTESHHTVPTVAAKCSDNLLYRPPLAHTPDRRHQRHHNLVISFVSKRVKIQHLQLNRYQRNISGEVNKS